MALELSLAESDVNVTMKIGLLVGPSVAPSKRTAALHQFRLERCYFGDTKGDLEQALATHTHWPVVVLKYDSERRV